MNARYLEAFELTLELIHRLEAFLRREESPEQLAAWAKSAWPSQYGQEGPLASNGLATVILINAMNAGQQTRSGELAPRRKDVRAYVRYLRQGRDLDSPRPLYLASPTAPFTHFVEELALPTEQHVFKGIGWQELLRFASPATGRVFVLRRSIDRIMGEDHPGTFFCAPDGEPIECLVDLMETLGIDLADLSWVSEPLQGLAFPTWTLWRQDDNGNKAQMQTFTGYRKARAELARFEALGHKQTYWLEGPTP